MGSQAVGRRHWVVLACLVLAACGGMGRIEPETPEPRSSASVTDFLNPTATWTATVRPAATSTPGQTRTATPTNSPTATPTPVTWAHIDVENVARLELLTEMRYSDWDLVTALAWSPSSIGAVEVLAAAVGNAIFLYRAGDWSQLARLEVGALTPGLAISPDGQWLAAGSRDGWLRVWNLPALLAAPDAQIGPAWQVVAHRKGVNSLSFSPEGELLASGGNDAVARLWVLASGELLRTTVGGTYAVPMIAFTPDGKALGVVNGKMIRLREVSSARILGSFQADAPLFSLAFSPDGQLLAAGDNDNRVLVWETAQAYRSGMEEYPQPVVFSGHAGQAGNYRALIWQVVFSPDGSLLASAGGDGSVRIWDVRGNRSQMVTWHAAGVTSLGFSPDGRLLASGSLDHTLRIWGVRE
jgi:WD40 repeat protein